MQLVPVEMADRMVALARREAGWRSAAIILASDPVAERREIARCYRNIGYYFVEQQMWDEAVGCYLLSMSFGEAEGRYQAEQELHYIYEETKGEAERPSIGAMRSYGEKYGFPIGPDEKVIETAMLYGKTMLAQKKFQHASYFLDIAYKLTENKEIKQVLDGVNEQLAAQH